ncbi:hypothetical protein CKO13_05080, partial [Halorhodospira neutriphila]|nr:hypothetical protein [Halorhodospira neutriphila]
MVVLASVAAFMLLALWSYRLGDPDWGQLGGGATPVGNLGGLAGAWFADAALRLFGYLAYLLPLSLGWAAYRAFQLLDSGPFSLARIDTGLLAVRLGGLVLGVVAAAALTSLNVEAAGLPLAAGGLLGEAAAGGLTGLLGFGGASLMALALLLAGVTLLTGFSWLALTEWVGGWTLALIDRLRRQLAHRQRYLERLLAPWYALQRLVEGTGARAAAGGSEQAVDGEQEREVPRIESKVGVLMERYAEAAPAEPAAAEPAPAGEGAAAAPQQQEPVE